MTRETWKIDEIKDIDTVVETFNGLVAQLCRDGGQLGELYVKAERKAARFALLSEAVIDSMTSGVLVVEATGEINLVNAAARGLLGIGSKDEVVGKRLAGVLADASELETLLGESLRTSTNVSRRMLTVTTKSGRKASLGASISCVKSGSSKPDAAIMVFTELGPQAAPASAGSAAAGATAPARGLGTQDDSGAYLRGVLDCYDHFSAVVREVERLQAKVERGTLEASDITACGAATRRAWEMVTAFALSLVGKEAITEIADVAGLTRAVLGRRKEFEGVKAAVAPEGAAGVKTVRKVLEAGLELVLLGCAGDAGGDVSLMAGPARAAGQDTAEIEIVERAPKTKMAPVGNSLREFRLDQDLRREAGLMLLKSLPTHDHAVTVDQRPEAITFRITFLAPVGKGTGPTASAGDIAERGPDEI